MKNINWKVRFKNPIFWIANIAIIALSYAAFKGIDLENLTNNILTIIEKASILVAATAAFYLGNVVDKTTPQIKDSKQAQNYTSPGIPAEKTIVDIDENVG